MYVGLNLTYASVFQMLRGSVVIFTGLLSVIFLKRKLYCFHWLGMLLVLSGLALVGVASVLDDDGGAGAPNPVVGDILVIAAQLVVAIQMVVEEKLLGNFDVPALQAVGLEGMFGLLSTTIMLFIFYWIPGTSGGNHFESSPDAIIQMANSWIVVVAALGTVFSIAFFNYFGMTVTKVMSATTRMVLDSMRTVLIWGVSLAIGWQTFQYLQVIGFVLLLGGTCIYNRIPYPIPGLYYPPEDGEKEMTINADENDEYGSTAGKPTGPH